MDPPEGADGMESASGSDGLKDALRVRRERSARFLARQVPPDARVVGLVYASLGPGRTARATLELADALAIRRDHTLLAGMESGEDSLDGILGGRSEDGLVDVLRGKNRLTEVAIRDPARPYVYLPAGRNARPAPELVQLEAFRRFADRVRERGGTLLLHLPREALPVASAGGLLDGYVSLGRGEEAPEGAREFGRVVFPEEDLSGPEPPAAVGAGPAAPAEAGARATAAPTEAGAEGGDAAPDAAVPDQAPAAALEEAIAKREAVTEGETESEGDKEPDGETEPEGEAEARTAPEAERPPAEEMSVAPASAPDPAAGSEEETAGARPGSWTRHRKAAGPPVTWAAVGLAVIAALALGWWLLALSVLPGSEAPEAGGAAAAGSEVAAAAEAGAAGRGAPPDPALLAAAVERAPELPYSVLIASYAARPDAVERLRELEEGVSAEAGGFFFLAPTPVQGAVYHRVFAGARADTTAAVRLMERLVEGGFKERTHPWDVRPVRLAFRLGVYGSRAAAAAARAEMGRGGIPAYLMPVPAGGDTAFQLYAGAYESEAAARPMRALLELVEREGELMARRGEPR